jgi:ATP-dependent exoDNAse (exonuclease V) alpha subunit
MNIKTHFSNFNLTADQSNTLTQLEGFLKSDKNVFLLKGYAGTGKTTLLKGIVKCLQSQNQFAHLMAPTGRAAKVLKDKTGVGATTIHKGIYNFEKLCRINQEKELENKTFKFFFDLNLNGYQPNQVFIVDEASMISNQYTEDEFFSIWQWLSFE